MQKRNRQNEVVVAVVVFSALALALAFGILLTLGNNSNNPTITSTARNVIVAQESPSPFDQTPDASHPVRPPRPTETSTRQAVALATTSFFVTDSSTEI